MKKIGVFVLLTFLIFVFCNKNPFEKTNPHNNFTTKIVFQSNRDGNYEIYIMDVDGSNQTRLTFSDADDTEPACKFDGSKIAFTSDRDGNKEIYVMNTDGSGQTRLTNSFHNDCNPSWSPDGYKIAFSSDRDGNQEIYVMNSDGSGQTRLTNNFNNDIDPAWSPDGTKIAYTIEYSGSGFYGIGNIFIMNAYGSNQYNLTYHSIGFIGGGPAWSPDGTKIVYFGMWIASSGNDTNIFIINADGTGSTRITKGYIYSDSYPYWSIDEKHVAFTSNKDGNEEIYLMKIYGSDMRRLTNNSAEDSHPAWITLIKK